MKAPAALAGLLLLAACQVVDRVLPPEAPAPDSASASRGPAASISEDLIAYVSRLRAMNEAGLTAEAARQKQAAARTAADVEKLKAALALTLAQSEEAEVLALVDPVARNPSAPGDVRAMASFLQVLTQDRRRLKESAAAARTTLRDERRALEAQKQRADAMQERAAQLQQKLDALTALEKSLSDRPPPSR